MNIYIPMERNRRSGPRGDSRESRLSAFLLGMSRFPEREGEEKFHRFAEMTDRTAAQAIRQDIRSSAKRDRLGKIKERKHIKRDRRAAASGSESCARQSARHAGVVELISVDRRRKLFQRTPIERLHRLGGGPLSARSNRLFPSNAGTIKLFVCRSLVSPAVYSNNSGFSSAR